MAGETRRSPRTSATLRPPAYVTTSATLVYSTEAIRGRFCHFYVVFFRRGAGCNRGMCHLRLAVRCAVRVSGPWESDPVADFV